jgi:lipopolysaccharide transport system permease protein
MNRWFFLFSQWFKRDLAGRYRGSWLGLGWPIIQPLAQISVFTLVFHFFMDMRWPLAEAGFAEQSGSPNLISAAEYGVNVLAGLAVFNFFADVLSRSPSAIFSQPSLVTKVRFPLALLPMVTTAVAMLHIASAFAIAGTALAIMGRFSWEMLWIAVWTLPVALYGFGLSLLFASLGVYVRDIGQAMPAVISLLMFLTPIFYPLNAIPVRLRSLFEANPIAWAAESLRDILLRNQSLVMSDWLTHLFASLVICLVASLLFKTLQRGFADVL